MREPHLGNLPPGLRTPPRTEPFWLAVLVVGAVAALVLLVFPMLPDLPFSLVVIVALPLALQAIVALVISSPRRGRGRRG